MRYYYLCSSCRSLGGPHEGLPKTPPRCCPHPTVARWPSEDALRLLEIGGQERAKGIEGRRVGAVFLSAALERLLEDTLRPLLRASEVLPRHVEERKAFFEKKTGRRVADVLRAAGLQNFGRDWKELIRVRNQIAHGRFFLDRSMSISALREIGDDAVAAFGALMAVSLGTAGAPRRQSPLPTSRPSGLQA